MATLLFRNEEEILSGIPYSQLETFYETCIKLRKAQLDLEYMQSVTLWTDLKLLWRTAASCAFDPKICLVKNRGADSSRRRVACSLSAASSSAFFAGDSCGNRYIAERSRNGVDTCQTEAVSEPAF